MFVHNSINDSTDKNNLNFLEIVLKFLFGDYLCKHVNTQFGHLLFHRFLIHGVIDGTFSKYPLSQESTHCLVRVGAPIKTVSDQQAPSSASQA